MNRHAAASRDSSPEGLSPRQPHPDPRPPGAPRRVPNAQCRWTVCASPKSALPSVAHFVRKHVDTSRTLVTLRTAACPERLTPFTTGAIRSVPRRVCSMQWGKGVNCRAYRRRRADPPGVRRGSARVPAPGFPLLPRARGATAHCRAGCCGMRDSEAGARIPVPPRRPPRAGKLRGPLPAAFRRASTRGE